MMVIRPVERSDVSALMQLASKTGGGVDDTKDVEVMVASNDDGVRLVKCLIL